MTKKKGLWVNRPEFRGRALAPKHYKFEEFKEMTPDNMPEYLKRKDDEDPGPLQMKEYPQ